MRISDWSSDVCSSDLRGGGTFPCPLAFALLVGRVTGEEARRREFAQLHADHVFIDRHRHELAAVVDVEGQPHELREDGGPRSEEHTSELQSLMLSSYAVFCLQKKTYTEILVNYNMYK